MSRIELTKQLRALKERLDSWHSGLIEHNIAVDQTDIEIAIDEINDIIKTLDGSYVS